MYLLLMLLKVIKKRIERGVIDTNIEVNEIKTILQQAKDGKFSLSALMNNPTVKKAFDFIKGVTTFGNMCR